MKSTKGISTMIALIGMIALLIVGFVAGSALNSGTNEFSGEYPEDSEWRTDSISIAGSTTVLPVANTAAVEFMNMYTGTTVTVQGGGSGTGYASALDGTVNIGMGSRGPKQSEIDTGDIWLTPIALDAVCVVVNPSVGSNVELTLEEVAMIFAGEYTNWNQVDSSLPNAEIYVVVRESGSGTRGTFEEYTIDKYGLDIDSTMVHEQPSNPAVRNAVSSTPNSIGYIGFGFLTNDIVAVSLAAEEGSVYIPATLENIQNGLYPISRFLYFITGSPVESGSLADRFISFVLSEDGQNIAENEGYLRMPANYNYP
ncbi:MAG: phosphate ABC transporter substrate-binding protein [Candidatus Bathyarchaeota archaeon]|nr:phosphate ABC transporter substrate-binding protein [Candidatus Bathyarchaeum tardum]WGM90704.1 MAG: phosphate ABC transporter substrate-binding protein [Candidatus Bathyarchaeum tardum]